MKSGVVFVIMLRIVCASIMAVSLPGYCQEFRYYGIDHHASIENSCVVTAHHGTSVTICTFSGKQCPYFTTLFFTHKIHSNSEFEIHAQEDALLTKTAETLEHDLTVVSTKESKDRALDGVDGREELIKFTKDISNGYIWEFADNSANQTVYITAVVVTLNPFAVTQNSDAVTVAVSKLLMSLQISSASH